MRDPGSVRERVMHSGNQVPITGEAALGTFRCPNGHVPQRGIICGGDLPFLRRGGEEGRAPNAYFFVDLQSGAFIR